MQLSDLRIVVTGAASGMGRVFARELATAGASVAAMDVAADGLETLRAELGSLAGDVQTFVCDVSDEASVQAAFGAAIAAFGSLNGLINNAGIFRDGLLVKKDRTTGEVKTMTLANWQKVIDVDLTGPFLCTREFAAHVIESGTEQAVVVNISSVSRHGNPGQSNYSAAKAGLVADTRLWASELARYGIRVGAVAPGFVDTPILRGMRDDVLAGLIDTVPLRRMGRPEEIWQGVRFAIECDYFTGRVIEIDGGVLL